MTEHNQTEFRESIEELHIKGLRIIQDKKRFRFGTDAVLLADFARIKDNSKVCDLGTGTAVIPILMSARSRRSTFHCIEIQQESAEMAERSVRLNGLQDRIHIIRGDIKDAFSLAEKNTFDAVTSNPPYMAVNSGNRSREKEMDIARHEILCTLEDVIKSAAGLLKSHGKFFLIHKPFRLPEIMSLLKSYGLEPKRMRLVHPYADKEPAMVLIESEKGACPYLRIESPLAVYSSPGRYTEETERIYGRDREH